MHAGRPPESGTSIGRSLWNACLRYKDRPDLFLGARAVLCSPRARRRPRRRDGHGAALGTADDGCPPEGRPIDGSPECKTFIGDLCWMPWTVSSACLADLSPLVMGLHGYVGCRPAGHLMGAATEPVDRVCRRILMARGGRASLAPAPFRYLGGSPVLRRRHAQAVTACPCAPLHKHTICTSVCPSGRRGVEARRDGKQ